MSLAAAGASTRASSREQQELGDRAHGGRVSRACAQLGGTRSASSTTTGTSRERDTLGSSGIKSLVSTKIVEGVERFSGEDEKWKKFSSSFETCMSNVGLDEYMTTSSQEVVAEADLRWPSLPDDESRKMSKALYILLNAVLGEGKARNIFDSCKKNEGFLVWKRLKTEYESKQGNRLTSILTGLLSPGECWRDDAQAGKSFMTSMLAWENDIEDYVKESGKPFDNSVKVSVVMAHAPPIIRDHLDNQSHSIGEDFEVLRSFVRSFCKAKQVYNRSGVKVKDDGGARPMEIGGIEWQGKGGKWRDNKGKKGDWQGKGKWSHSKGDGKGKKGKHKGVKGKFGKYNQKVMERARKTLSIIMAKEAAMMSTSTANVATAASGVTNVLSVASLRQIERKG